MAMVFGDEVVQDIDRGTALASKPGHSSGDAVSDIFLIGVRLDLSLNILGISVREGRHIE